MGPRFRSPEDLFKAFWSKVPDRKAGECWPWMGSRSGRGLHGQVRQNYRLLYAHRVAFEYFRGPIPEGLLVRHTCDVPHCVNPTHMLVGTQADNMMDMKLRGRSGRTKARRAAACSEIDTTDKPSTPTPEAPYVRPDVPRRDDRSADPFRGSEPPALLPPTALGSLPSVRGDCSGRRPD